MSAARHLRVIDEDGVELDGCPACARKDDEVAGLQRDIRGWAARYAELKRDREAEARGHKLWPTAKGLHDYWRTACRHPRSAFTADAFWLMEPQIRTFGEATCRRAIDGAAYDPFTKKRKNGSLKRFDAIDLIFRDSMHVEDFANRAPRAPA